MTVKTKAEELGRNSPNYHPSGHGPYGARWRKAERRERAVARQKALCESGRKVLKKQSVILDGAITTEAVEREPVDWRMMLPVGERS
jgi:hypothetical protein